MSKVKKHYIHESSSLECQRIRSSESSPKYQLISQKRGLLVPGVIQVWPKKVKRWDFFLVAGTIILTARNRVLWGVEHDVIQEEDAQADGKYDPKYT